MAVGPFPLLGPQIWVPVQVGEGFTAKGVLMHGSHKLRHYSGAVWCHECGGTLNLLSPTCRGGAPLLKNECRMAPSNKMYRLGLVQIAAGLAAPCDGGTSEAFTVPEACAAPAATLLCGLAALFPALCGCPLGAVAWSVACPPLAGVRPAGRCLVFICLTFGYFMWFLLVTKEIEQVYVFCHGVFAFLTGQVAGW